MGDEKSDLSLYQYNQNFLIYCLDCFGDFHTQKKYVLTFKCLQILQARLQFLGLLWDDELDEESDASALDVDVGGETT